MSLLKTETNAAATAAFETEDDMPTTAAATATATGTATAKPAATVAAPANTAVAVAQPMLDLVGAYKNAMRVEYNTLEAIIATNGNFVSRETKKVLGDEVTFELLSYQDAYVVTTNDDKAPQELLRYSDDGIMCSDGTSVQEHLDVLRQDYPKASVKPRTVVVGALKSTSKPAGMEETLVQFDLSPASRTMWNRLQANIAYMAKVGRVTEVKLIKANAELSTAGTNTFTLARFSLA